MTKHPRNVEGFEGSLKKLAESIGNMTYDQTASLIEKLAQDIEKQADADLARKPPRKRLAKELYSVANELYNARDSMNRAWEICKPYMKNNHIT